MVAKTESITTINGFSSPEEAEAHRNKLLHKDLYGLYGIYKDEQTQLWVPMPLKVLTAIMEFKESEEAKLKEKNNG